MMPKVLQLIGEAPSSIKVSKHSAQCHYLVNDEDNICDFFTFDLFTNHSRTTVQISLKLIFFLATSGTRFTKDQNLPSSIEELELLAQEKGLPITLEEAKLLAAEHWLPTDAEELQLFATGNGGVPLDLDELQLQNEFNSYVKRGIQC